LRRDIWRDQQGRIVNVSAPNAKASRSSGEGHWEQSSRQVGLSTTHSGSGTTLIAAEQLGRKCYGMEISPAYCDVIVKRWETLTGKKATLEVPNGKTRAKARADDHQDGERQPRQKAAQQKEPKPQSDGITPPDWVTGVARSKWDEIVPKLVAWA
jgi:hypothetical protein